MPGAYQERGIADSSSSLMDFPQATSPCRLVGSRITLASLTAGDVTDPYVDWMNDPLVNRYTESRYSKHTRASVESYVSGLENDPNHLFLAIYRNEQGRHIGNIKLGPIDWRHRVGDIGIIIGDRDSWGMGIATEAISLLSQHADEVLRLHKLTAGCYAPNESSRRAFEKAGFQTEGVKRSHYLYEGQWLDAVLMAKLFPHNTPL
jgi:RimJ/RimL family protein N-acetyltransferase